MLWILRKRTSSEATLYLTNKRKGPCFRQINQTARASNKLGSSFVSLCSAVKELVADVCVVDIGAPSNNDM